MPPKGAPAADPQANAMFIMPDPVPSVIGPNVVEIMYPSPCQVPLDLKGTMSDMMIDDILGE